MSEKPKHNRHWTWEEWQNGRYARRMTGKKVAPAVIRRSESSSDKHLRAAFGGERGLPFATDEELKKIAEELGGDTEGF